MPPADDEFDDDLRTTQLQIAPTPVPSAPRSRDRLIVLRGAGAIGQAKTLEPVTTIGRDPECTIPIAESSVSRRHARVVRRPDGSLRLDDLESRNGTFVNGARAIAPVTLNVGDRIALGSRVMLLLTHDDPLEKELRERQKMEAIGRMAAGISHDFNNLVGAAMATLEHVESQYRSGDLIPVEANECFSDLRCALSRAADLTQSLATLGRRGETVREQVDVAEVCKEVIRLCRRTFGADYRIECAAEPGMTVVGSRTELHQVLLNLCLNARDAMTAGGTLSIEVWRSSEADGGAPLIVLKVADTGVGMDPNAVKQAFEPFFTTKPAGRGTGLGLSTASELVRGMGGDIDLDSKPGRGTTFLIRLPAHRRDGDDPAQRPTTRRGSGPQAGPVRGRIIVADDQDLVRRSIGRLLRVVGHDVFSARDGGEALNLLARTHPRPNLLVVDLDMPGVGGADVLNEVRQMERPPPVIIITGHWDPERREDLLRRGAAAYLPKPVDGDELRETVASLLAQYRSASTRVPPKDT